MRAAVLDEFGGTLRLEARPVPEPGPGHVLVEVVACGAGLTVEGARMGHLGGSAPRILGHEYGGRVAAVGPGVARWAEGDAVTGSFYLFCGACPLCSSGRETLCPNLAGYVGAHIDGAFAEYIVVPERNLVAVPDGVPLDLAGIVADAVATPYHVAAQRAVIKPGDRVVVVGAGGGVGVHMVEVARAFGGRVLAVERDAGKVARLRDLGYEVVDAAHDDWPGRVAEATGGGADAVVDMVGSDATLAAGLGALGVGGRLVVVGLQPGATITVDPARLVFGEVVLTGNRYATRAEIAASLELVRTGAVRCVAETRVPLDRVQEAMDIVAGNGAFGRVVVECR